MSAGVNIFIYPKACISCKMCKKQGCWQIVSNMKTWGKHEDWKLCCRKTSECLLNFYSFLSVFLIFFFSLSFFFSDRLFVGVAAWHGAYLPRAARHSDVSHSGHHAVHWLLWQCCSGGGLRSCLPGARFVFTTLFTRWFGTVVTEVCGVSVQFSIQVGIVAVTEVYIHISPVQGTYCIHFIHHAVYQLSWYCCCHRGLRPHLFSTRFILHLLYPPWLLMSCYVAMYPVQGFARPYSQTFCEM